MPISLAPNQQWLSKATRPKVKYSPVKVTGGMSEAAEMKAIVERRIEECQKMGMIKHPNLSSAAWFSFQRDQMRERNLRSHNVPIFVLSGGNSGRIKSEFDNAHGYTLAWHPATARNEPVYLFVHKSDYETYRQTLSAEFAQYRNLYLVGWSGGTLTGFGAARSAVLSYADTVHYQPKRLIMMDQDVMATEATRPTEPRVMKEVNNLHANTGKRVIGYGVGFSTRAPIIPSTSEQLKGSYSRDFPAGGPAPGENLTKREKQTLKSRRELPERTKAFDFRKESHQERPSAFAPTQQFVSITAPFRDANMQDGAYQAFMVAGGEDMLMTEELSLQTKNVEGRPTANPTVRPEKIFKSDLSHGNTVRGDSPNAYWTVDRIKTLTTLQSSEKGTRVIYDGVETTVGALSESLATIAKMPKSDAAGICALIIERIILKAYQTEGAWPETYKGSIMNRSFPEIAKAHIAARKGV